MKRPRPATCPRWGWLGLAFSFVLAASTLAHADAVSAFKRAWAEAPDAQARIDAVDALAATGSEDAAKTLLAVLAAGQGEASALSHAIEALAGMQGTEGDAFLQGRFKKSKKWVERGLIARVFSQRTESAEARESLIAGLKDREWQVQAACVRGLSRFPHKDSVGSLVALLGKLKGRAPEDLRLTGDVMDALYRLTGLKQGDAESWGHWWEVKEADWTPGDKEHSLVEHETATTARIPPLFEEVYSRRVIFVVDTSSSMKIPTGGEVDESHPEGLTRFEVMVRELKKIIASLPKEAKFNVIGFS
ncbi:MAG: HEAT repeat domain-containing protein, partial [Planctomycetota bacterium]